ncbi:pleckstrin homology domain-containing family A member 5 isoform X30 [Erinaceus europaeus]|uniref:Pleckstrin homology domain-containing family A member 5 isoform X30 n=1 Tax=Erinaceus europaeus TaxID=9365 RepID=A0ABM3XNQ4_ERIEU|nr:pleckstrin homology domain-containing family A member 5 isoform X30 [Erinaceus europaeus]
MAADLNLEWICSLPRSWTYGITRGGRVFFINEEAKSTTWLHPVTGEAVVTGHRRQSTDLPTGWEEAYTFEGARYYIKALVSCGFWWYGGIEPETLQPQAWESLCITIMLSTLRPPRRMFIQKHKMC